MHSPLLDPRMLVGFQCQIEKMPSLVFLYTQIPFLFVFENSHAQDSQLTWTGFPQSLRESLHLFWTSALL